MEANQQQQAVIKQQPGVPGQINWMPVPQAPLGCPPGLEYLTAIDQVVIQQQIELLEAFTGFETNNKFKVCNSMGQQVYFAAEASRHLKNRTYMPADVLVVFSVALSRLPSAISVGMIDRLSPHCDNKTKELIISYSRPPPHFQVAITDDFHINSTTSDKLFRDSLISCEFLDTDCCTRQFCGPGRPFEMRVFDNYQREVIHLSRPLRCQCCCCPCCLQEIEVQSPPGTVIGYVEQKWTLWKAKFEIQDAQRVHIMTINGPCCPCSCGSDVEFPVSSADGSSQIGLVSKHWTGFVREMFTDAENFGITFPLDLDVKFKAILMGACFLIDYMFFEHSN